MRESLTVMTVEMKMRIAKTTSVSDMAIVANWCPQ